MQQERPGLSERPGIRVVGPDKGVRVLLGIEEPSDALPSGDGRGDVHQSTGFPVVASLADKGLAGAWARRGLLPVAAQKRDRNR